jgi:hypothetical protein
MHYMWSKLCDPHWHFFYLERDTIYIGISEFVCREIDGIWQSSQALRTDWSKFFSRIKRLVGHAHWIPNQR